MVAIRVLGMDLYRRAQGTYRIYQGCEEFIDNDEYIIYGLKNFSHEPERTLLGKSTTAIL